MKKDKKLLILELKSKKDRLEIRIVELMGTLDTTFVLAIHALYKEKLLLEDKLFKLDPEQD